MPRKTSKPKFTVAAHYLDQEGGKLVRRANVVPYAGLHTDNSLESFRVAANNAKATTPGGVVRHYYKVDLRDGMGRVMRSVSMPAFEVV